LAGISLYIFPLWKRGIEGDFMKKYISIKSPLAPLYQRGVQKDSRQAGMTNVETEFTINETG